MKKTKEGKEIKNWKFMEMWSKDVESKEANGKEELEWNEKGGKKMEIRK